MIVTYSGLTVTGGTVITSVWGNMVRDGTTCIYASAAVRDATLTGALAPTEGMTAYLLDIQQITIFDGVNWVYLIPTGISDPTTDSTLSAGTTTSTSYTDSLTGAGGVSATITAPQSGNVLVLLNGTLANSGANATYLSFRTSGGATEASSDEWSISHVGTSPERAGVSRLITGLTGGTSYTFTVQHKTAAGTATFDDRTIIAIPLN
jgi:hypothetical protein